MPIVRVQFPPYHAAQLEVVRSPARFRALAWGRRAGKSWLVKRLGYEAAMAGGEGWWVWPSHKVSLGTWRSVCKDLTHLAAAGHCRLNQTDRFVEFGSGGILRFRHADDPESLVADALDFVLVSEAARIPRLLEVWHNSLEPTLIDRAGWAMLEGRPRGRNDWHTLYERAKSDPDSSAHHATTFDNPLLPRSELDRIRRAHDECRIADLVYRQEYLAEFIEGAGAVFRRILEACSAEPESPREGRDYVIGVDLAKSIDFTVLSVFDAADRRQVCIERFNQVDYVLQEARIAALAARYNDATVIVETNNTGEAMCERLERRGIRLVRFTTTSATKSEAVEALAVAIENGECTLLADDVQIGELSAYEATMNKLGRRSYSAPDGMHDDTVMAAVIAWTELAPSHVGGAVVW